MCYGCEHQWQDLTGTTEEPALQYPGSRTVGRTLTSWRDLIEGARPAVVAGLFSIAAIFATSYLAQTKK